jgi:hypothetical protein
VVSTTDPHGRILGFLDRNRYYFFQAAPQLYSQNLVEPGIDPGTSGSVDRNSDHQKTETAPGKRRLERKADNLTVVCEPILLKMW